MTPRDQLLALIAADGKRVDDLRRDLQWQARLYRDVASTSRDAESRRRHGWHAAALQSAFDVVPRLRRATVDGSPAARTGARAGAPPSPAKPAQRMTTAMLLELGWLAWEHGLETDALRILGGVGGLAEGHLGRAMLQASAFMRSQRLDEAADLLHEAIRQHTDPIGDASATLALLWRTLGNPAWRGLASRVAGSAASEMAREACAEALKSIDPSRMGPADGSRGLLRQSPR